MPEQTGTGHDDRDERPRTGGVERVERIWPDPRVLTLDELRDEYARTWPDAADGSGAMMIASLDGSAVLGAVSGGLSSPADQKLMDVQRGVADVVVIGAGTLRDEGYGGLRVEADSTAWRRARGLPDHPVLAVVSRSLGLDPEAPFLAQAPVRPLILTGGRSCAQRRRRLQEVADVVVLDDGRGGVDPVAAHELFASRGWRRVHSEGGPSVLAAWLAAGRVAELHLSLAPVLAGGRALGLLGAAVHPRRLELRRILRDGSMLLTRYRVLPDAEQG
ncbi:dihydrofolate reductase family protein [Kocuria palustris]|uniref:dihydrofolate reductase family protein n=1 Tax=Kocuria palustris TaxID=71999 RepID=UPI0016434628|nr:dihydrofolate reductase family protein [Kocuria palustris]